MTHDSSQHLWDQSSTDPKLLERANKNSDALVERLEKEFDAKVIRGDGYVEIPGYGLLVEKISITETYHDKYSGSTDTRHSSDVEVRRHETRYLAWAKIEPKLEEILLAVIAAEDIAAKEQEKQRHEAQQKHQQLVGEAKAKFTPEELEALRTEFSRR
jgi:hypothetical protein